MIHNYSYISRVIFCSKRNNKCFFGIDLSIAGNNKRSTNVAGITYSSIKIYKCPLPAYKL
ncbi:hypothetical protein SAMN02745978_01822 [Butyricicoccus pullicaecorum DSM 23266]|uniref:Uncharacterized protein n=1 Tax=Butyricicoccus pullicaecorum 1.2 TaxID=1203606 RepID=R8VUW1_9FIRM|nr:hypothetical protein HMPREF1526_02298 [Butyricicoccus pullicaecorum 1.2]SKA59927.1 hypothetical protein SAMN02745978_01822 [Butyricicoccus pullicaecorum DSM 23266]